MTSVVILFGVAAFGVWLGKRHLDKVAAEEAEAKRRTCQHRPVIEMDGTLDYCERCGSAVNW